MKPILFTNISLFDGSGKAPYPGEVRVRGNGIDAIAERGQQLDRADASVIDGKGMTLMPGMVEAHTHLTWPSSVERVINTMKLPVEEHLLVTAQNARVTLDHGFTSAYSAGSLGQRFEVALRDMINAGHIPGPRLRASSLERGLRESSQMKGFDEVLGVPKSHDADQNRNIDELRAYIREMAALTLDSIKFVLNDAFAPPGSQGLIHSDEEVQAIGEAARRENIWLACHAQTAEAIKQGVRAGFRAIFHCTHADEEALDMMEAKKNELFTTPAAGLLYARAHEAGLAPGDFLHDNAAADLEIFQTLVPQMKKRGIRVLPGGDYGFPYNPVGRNARDLAIFVDLFGYSPTEVLVAATKLGGEMMDMPVGCIKPGYLADLLLVDGDPTIDVTILQDKARIPAVMKDGRFHRAPLQYRETV